MRAAAAVTGGGPRAAQARAALVASAPLLLGVVLAALVCYPVRRWTAALAGLRLRPSPAAAASGGLRPRWWPDRGSAARDRLPPPRSPARAGRLGRPGRGLLPACHDRGGAPGAHRGAPRTPRRRTLLRRQPVRLRPALRRPAGTSARLRLAALRRDSAPGCRARAAPRRPRRLLGRGHGDDERALRVDSGAGSGCDRPDPAAPVAGLAAPRRSRARSRGHQRLPGGAAIARGG